ncbi:class I SAM-dependent methyltransferase [Chakrabartyella piscis]|uniref:tRNA (adenine(22)-N(1))-methyltransferase n=1 Tax=Chakrabartyella piscis TaxID=2918914 RepID=UPI0029584C95|nr:class I SAM-dependent methyltransferase [Chakrabartyella piscis]
MEISKRLKQVTDFVAHPIVADIGCDHGYVPIYLYTIGKITKAYACDVRKGPLSKAQENIKAYGAEDVIETRLGSGFVPMQAGEAQTGIIAGMGGMLTIHILEESKEVVDSLEQLVLSPQQDMGEVRKYLHKIGYRIDKECMLEEEGRYYWIMSCVHGTESYATEAEYLYGKLLLEEKNPLLLEWLIDEYNRLSLVAEKLGTLQTEGAKERLPQVQMELDVMKEALSWLKS